MPYGPLFLLCWASFVAERVFSKCVNDSYSVYKCPPRTVEFRGVCYQATIRPTSPYDQALSVCQELGGSLVKINDSALNQFLYELIWINYNTKPQKKPIPFWIGLNDLKQEGVYEWSRCADGRLKPGDYRMWYRLEPDNRIVLPRQEKSRSCVTWQYSKRPYWANENCQMSLPFICQIYLQFPDNAALIMKDTIIAGAKRTASKLSSQHATIIGISSAVLITILMLIALWMWKREKHRNRVTVLRQTGLHPNNGQAVVRANAFEIPT